MTVRDAWVEGPRVGDHELARGFRSAGLGAGKTAIITGGSTGIGRALAVLLGARGRAASGWEGTWTKRYTAGLMLLDLDDPSRVLGITREPVLVPEAPYEITSGFRPNVVFPTGHVTDGDESRIYYGAADSVICLATASTDELVAAVERSAPAEPSELAERAASVPVPKPATE